MPGEMVYGKVEKVTRLCMKARKREKMKYIQRLQFLKRRLASSLTFPCLVLLLLAGLVSGGLWLPARAKQPPQPQLKSLWATLPKNPRPFLHLPYYGNDKLQARVNSYFDHDKPWYADDNVFVRYDGKRWTGSDTSVMNCDPGHTCYDGHNGYDLRLHFEPVLSAAAGKVIRAGWYNSLNHSDGFGLWAAVDHGNGFATVYGHLSALTVSVGEHVNSQWQVGASGTSGSSTGPHLHFGTYYYPSWQATDPSGWQSQQDDPNSVPDYKLWSGGANTTPVPLLSSQGKLAAPGAVLIDDGSSGWTHTGQWQRAKTGTDIDGALHWTSTTGGSASATATWQSSLLSDGYYEIGVFVDDNHASSGWASYIIYSSDPAHHASMVKHHVEIDQEHVGSFQSPFGGVNTGAQWIGLGTYYFSSAHPGRVVLSNATGENGMQLAADGVEFAPLISATYGFTLSGDSSLTQMSAGGSAPLNLTLQNTSNFPWQANTQNAVQLIYRWLDDQGHVLSTSKPVALARDLKAGASQPIQVSVQAPAQAGTYTLQWDLIQGTRVFSKLGAQAKQESITVTAVPPATPTPCAGASCPGKKDS